MTRDDYSNGYRFGMAYGRNHGLRSLLRLVERDGRQLRGATQAPAYVAGEVDAALVLVQMRGVR